MRVLTVDIPRTMRHNLLDRPLLLQIRQRCPCQRAVDLQAIDEDGDCDEAVGLDVFGELLASRFVEDDGVVGLVLHCVRGGWLVGSMDGRGGSGDGCGVPFPLDHFFFCFFPAAAGAILCVCIEDSGSLSAVVKSSPTISRLGACQAWGRSWWPKAAMSNDTSHV